MLSTLQAAIPPGYKVALSAPCEEQLEYKSIRGAELVHRQIMFNWAAVGWCAGIITGANQDGRCKLNVNGEMKVANFLATYTDETVAKHYLSLEIYGDAGLHEDGHWVLLEEASPTV